MFISLWLFPFILMTIDGTIPIGRIDHGAYVSSTSPDTLLYNMTCTECLCYAFAFNTSSTYQGFNCYMNNQTCALFIMYLSLSMVQINRDSIFLFRKSETSQTTHADEATSSMTTFPVSYYIPKWNRTAIILASYGSLLYQINHPYGLFIAANSDILYIADSDNDRILKWLPGAASGILLAGGQGRGLNATQLNDPREVCIDQEENIYVADSGNYRVQYFHNGSSIGQSIAGNDAYNVTSDPLGNLLGLGVDLNKNVYISEYDKARATKWVPNATFGLIVAGNGTQGNSLYQLNIPTAFYTDPITGTLYIPNQSGHCITKWSSGSSFGVVVAGLCGISGSNETLLNSPKCVTFDKYGNMYVIDGVNGGRILMFIPDSLVGIPIITSGLSNPISIAVDTQLTLYVSDWNNNRILKYILLQ